MILEPMSTDAAAMPWALIEQLGDTPFMAAGRDQPEMPEDREIFER
ncbi:MAG: hypothetical protein WDN69_29250 [Aliidongia sp.]